MKFNRKHISKLIVFSLLTIFTLQACNMPTTNPAENNRLEEIGVEANDPIEETPEEEPIEVEAVTENIATQDAIPADTEKTTMEEESTDTTIVNSLSQAEVDSLIFMREEEKLARDVYLALYDIWGLNIFQNIASSEQTHTDAVGNLLVTFNIPDPMDTSPAGEFVNADLQNLYDELTLLGSQSVADALKVGGAIEEIDILDLKESLEFVENPSIQRVYQNLLKGSENHLRAFVSNFERQTGESYQAQYMSEDDYQVIISASAAGGGRGRNRP